MTPSQSHSVQDHCSRCQERRRQLWKDQKNAKSERYGVTCRDDHTWTACMLRKQSMDESCSVAHVGKKSCIKESIGHGGYCSQCCRWLDYYILYWIGCSAVGDDNVVVGDDMEEAMFGRRKEQCCSRHHQKFLVNSRSEHILISFNFKNDHRVWKCERDQTKRRFSWKS